MGAVRAVHALGRQHEVALVSFDDIPLADVVEPGVTVVAQDPHALGRAAAELLFARLDGDDGPSRASSSCRPADRARVRRAPRPPAGSAHCVGLQRFAAGGDHMSVANVCQAAVR